MGSHWFDPQPFAETNLWGLIQRFDEHGMPSGRSHKKDDMLPTKWDGRLGARNLDQSPFCLLGLRDSISLMFSHFFQGAKKQVKGRGILELVPTSFVLVLKLPYALPKSLK